MIAMHAVEPVCPRCGQRVRSSVALQADLVDLQRTAAEMVGHRARPDRTNVLVVRLSELEAELQGWHLRCQPAVH